MGYLRRQARLARRRVKGKQLPREYQVRDEEGNIKAKQTTVKKALFQRAILTTIEQLQEKLKDARNNYPNQRMREYLHDLEQSNFDDRKTNKRNPKDVDELDVDAVYHPDDEGGKRRQAEVRKRQAELVKAIEDKEPREEIEEKAEALQEAIEETPNTGGSASSSGSTAKPDIVTRVAPQPDPEKEKAGGRPHQPKALDSIRKAKPRDPHDKGEKPKFETRDEPEKKPEPVSKATFDLDKWLEHTDTRHVSEEEALKNHQAMIKHGDIIEQISKAKMPQFAIEQEIKAYKQMKKLEKHDMDWLKVTALSIKNLRASEATIARYQARILRAKHNKQELPKGIS